MHTLSTKSLARSLALLLLLLLITPARAQKIDLNTNGVSDVWEYLFGATGANPNADDDGDGVPNILESIAGTDPYDSNSVPSLSFSASSTTNFTLSMPCALGKRYEWQSVQGLAGLGLSNWVTESVSVARTGSVITLNAPLSSTPKFFRLVISDVDTDGDGVNDWEEYKLGLDPLNANSNGQLDNNGQPMGDYAYATARLASQNVFTITATDPTATEPDPGQSALNPGVLTVTRGGFPLKAVTVNLDLAAPGPGIAIEGTDHDFLPRLLSFTPGMTSQIIDVTPLANTNRLAPVVATMKLLGSPNYSLGMASNASIVIYPSTTPLGVGLTGQYYTNANATYSSATNFNPANLKLTRIDTNIDFTWGTTSTPIANNGYYCVRWTGQVMPQYSETYFFVANTDDGVKLWINDQLIVNNWISKSASDSIGSITLQGGVRYNIKMEYFQITSTAVAHLSWYSFSQAKQIIPTARLFPTTNAPTAVTSPLSLVGFLGQPFTNSVTAANSPLGYTASALPPGLNFNPTNGLLSGIPSLAGDYQITLTATNTLGVGASVVDVQIIDTGSSITREVWTGVPGVNVSDIPVNTPATATNFLGALEGITGFGDNYGERIRGYLTAPSSGNYFFWLAANDSAELWISNDGEPANKVLRAFVTPGGTASRQWNLQAKQKSPWLALVAGQRYYIEVLHKAGVGTNDNWAVGWLQDPTGTNTTPAAGVVPGYVLSRHFPLPAAYVPGTLYAANMLPYPGAVSTGVGSATLRLSADETQAILSYHYSGLSTPVTSKHIHSDQYLNFPSQIIFDIDMATPQPDGSYVWNITPQSPLSSADIVELLKEGKAYLNIHTVNYGGGEIRGNFTLANGSQNFTPPPPPPVLTDDHANYNAASRFLIQSTFGPSPGEIAAVQSLGYDGWISNQFTLPPSHHLTNLYANVNIDPSDPYPGTLTFNTWWKQAVTAPDQLRQRVAFALSEIMVVSEAGVLGDNGLALSSYYDTLLDNGFGNFRTLLRSVTLTPTMGLYLDMRGNDKGDISSGRHANENYAREIMQLFSVGLYRMWPDGSLVMDSQGDLVPTYDQNVIMGFASVFTGWNYYQPNQGNGRLPTNFGPGQNYTNPMVLVPTHHDLGTKRLLDNVVLPQAWGSQADSTSTNFDVYSSQDLESALDSIFYNQTVGPFVCRQLIQRLVTSHPSREYLYRVVQKFNDNGSGVRGDMQAVIKAILLDYEARSTTMLTSPTYGKQREPLLRVTAAARAFPPPSPLAGTYTQEALQYVTNTTATPHRLNNGDTVRLDFTDGSGQPAPTSQSYNSGNPITVLSPTSFRVPAPGLITGSYAQTTNTTITNMLTASMVTTNVIMLNVSGHGLLIGNPVYLAFTAAGTYSQTTNTTFTNMLNASMETNTVIMVTLPGHDLAVGDSVKLHFTSGGAIPGSYQVVWTTNNNSFAVTTTDANQRSGSCYMAGAAADGVYQVMWTTNNNWFAVTTSDTHTRPTNNCFLPKLAGGGFTQTGTTLKMSPGIVHGLKAGDSVYINFSTGGTDGNYTVVTVPDPTHFTVTAPSSVNQTGNGQVIYPLVAPPSTRSGSVSISWNTWSVNYTDTGSNPSLSQTPLHSPTVFNFFFPDFKFPGPLASAGLTTPEFMLTSDTSVMFQMNFLEAAILNNGNNTNGLSSFTSGDGDIVMDIGPYMSQAYTSPGGLPSLVDTLNSLLTGGQLSASARATILGYVGNVANFPYSSPPTYTQMRDRVRGVVHLLLSSPDFTVQK